MSPRSLLVLVLVVLVLLLTWPPAAAGLTAGEPLDLADGRVFGHFIDDEGRIVIGVTHGRADFQARLSLWNGTKAKTLEVNHGGDFPILFKRVQAAAGSGDTFILQGAMKVDDSDHGAVVHQAYRLTSRGKLRRLWSVDTSRWIGREASIEFSPDGTMWGVMDGSVGVGRALTDPNAKKLHFAFGATKSSKVKRRETLAFEQGPHPDAEPEFLFLNSDGPVVLTSYADDYYLLRFTDFGVDSQQVDQLRPTREAYGRLWPLVRWQPEDRVLWSNNGQEWAAWDLWDLGLAGFPEEPFLRLERSSGEPHPVRGFVRQVVADRGYRIEHLWQSPQIEHLNERQVSDWRPGKPISVSVSPNGRHAVALEEVREDKDGEVELRKVLRRFELALEPPPPPRPAAEKKKEP